MYDTGDISVFTTVYFLRYRWRKLDLAGLVVRIYFKIVFVTGARGSLSILVLILFQ